MALSMLLNPIESSQGRPRSPAADRRTDISEVVVVHGVRAGASPDSRDSALGAASLGVSSQKAMVVQRVRADQSADTQGHDPAHPGGMGISASQAVAASRSWRTGQYNHSRRCRSPVLRSSLRARANASLDSVRAVRGAAPAANFSDASVLPVAHNQTHPTTVASDMAVLGSDWRGLPVFHGSIMGIPKRKNSNHRAFWAPRLYRPRLRPRYRQLVTTPTKPAAAPTASCSRPLHPAYHS